jgi:hypothetical protein
MAAPKKVVFGEVSPGAVVGSICEEGSVRREVRVDLEMVGQCLLGAQLVVASSESE